MAPPKRKSPERPKSRSKRPSLAARLGMAALGHLSSHPRLIAGIAIFGVVFSFVAANALWYQPKHHPAPLLATRMFEQQQPTRVAAVEPADDQGAEPGVTTFRIERQAKVDPAHPATAEKPVASPLVRSVQAALAERGLYDGPADGLTGPKTAAAILFYEETEGLARTGIASDALLKRLKAGDTAVAVVPEERPSMDVTASTRKSDDVAALIEQADVPLPVGPSAELVIRIQKALVRMAYANVKVDGIAGEATRTAIRAFEKSYRMKITGEPSEALLKKMKSLGMI